MADNETKEVALSPKDQAIKAFDVAKAAIAVMVEDAKKITVPAGDKKAYKEARAKLTEFVHKRVQIDNKRKDLGSEARTWIKVCNETGTELIELLAPGENHLREQVKAEDDRVAAEKAAAEKKEQERIEGIRAKIGSMTSMAANLVNLDVNSLQTIKSELEAIQILPDEYFEMSAEANLAKQSAMIAVMQAIENRERLDKEEADRKAEAERLEKQRKEQEAAQAEIDRRRRELEQEEADRKAKADAEEAERKAKIEAEEKARQEKLAAEEASRQYLIDWDQAIIDNKNFDMERDRLEFEAQKKAEQDRKDKEALEKRLAEEAKAKAEAEAKAAAEKAEADRIAAEKAEQDRKVREERLRPDREKLESWANGILEITVPDGMNDPSAVEVAESALNQIYFIANQVIDRSKEL